MKEFTLSIPELSLVVATRALAGAGVALLLADKLKRERRTAVGWTLLGVGVMASVPLLLELVLANTGPDTVRLDRRSRDANDHDRQFGEAEVGSLVGVH